MTKHLDAILKRYAPGFLAFRSDMIIIDSMKISNEKIPDPKEIEKELGKFLSKQFGENVKVVTPMVLQREKTADNTEKKPAKKKQLNFNLKPEELIDFLDLYVVKQDTAKAILATKICTHFNRITKIPSPDEDTHNMVGHIKNNVLMIGPTGVGKTYMIKLIAKRIGVPFVKGDATKFSETGYVGGDVEDLVRDLVREADDDIELAEYGIIYLDEIDKIASSRNLIGADVSRTGVQRALLKPLEETDVELNVPHDPISMIQQIEQYRKSGKREKQVVNTKNILFIMSGAFSDLTEIIKKRIQSQPIGFGAYLPNNADKNDMLRHIRSEDLMEFGFESEFVGRLPVRATFEKLTQKDLFNILKNPNNPIVLGKKLDFAAYGIQIKFDDPALDILSQNAFTENTGARGLVSAVESALLLFEKRLPSTLVKKFPITADVIKNPEKALETLLDEFHKAATAELFAQLAQKEKDHIAQYIDFIKHNLSEKFKLTLTPSRINTIASYYSTHITDVERTVRKVKSIKDEIKKIELYFYKNHDMNIVLEEDAIDFLIDQVVCSNMPSKDFYKNLQEDFKLGLQLVREKTGQSRFFINREALQNPESFISNLIKNELSETGTRRKGN